MSTDLRTPESAYAYMQSMSIPSFASFHQSILGISFTNDFMQEEPVVAPNEQVEPQQHGGVRR